MFSGTTTLKPGDSLASHRYGPPVTILRRHIHRHRWLAAWLAALALAMKLLVPGGYMPMVTDGGIVIQICSGSAPRTVVMTMPGMAHDMPAGEDHQGKQDLPCAFSGLSAPVLGAVDPILLAGALLVIVALGFRPLVATVRASIPHLRPPSRGPPLIA